MGGDEWVSVRVNRCVGRLAGRWARGRVYGRRLACFVSRSEPKHLAGPFFTEGSYTKNTAEEVSTSHLRAANASRTLEQHMPPAKPLLSAVATKYMYGRPRYECTLQDFRCPRHVPRGLTLCCTSTSTTHPHILSKALLPSTTPIHTFHPQLPSTPPIHTSHSHLICHSQLSSASLPLGRCDDGQPGQVEPRYASPHRC